MFSEQLSKKFFPRKKMIRPRSSLQRAPKNEHGLVCTCSFFGMPQSAAKCIAANLPEDYARVAFRQKNGAFILNENFLVNCQTKYSI